MAPSFKLISLNIEGNKHLDRVVPFLQKSGADVICLQELLEPEFNLLIKKLAMPGMFAPATRIGEKDAKNISGIPAVEGVGLLTRLPFTHIEHKYYSGSHHPIPRFVYGDMATVNRALVIAKLHKGGVPFMIATTHFTWTPDGKADDRQRKDMGAMLRALDETGEFVLTGDFNAPRGGEIFTDLATLYKDNIPEKYMSSIDPVLHSHGKPRVMVDGLFTTTQFGTRNVELVCGVSDHCAVVGEIYKN